MDTKGMTTSNNDHLFRISVKGYIRNKNGEVLVVRENGRTSWDLPGGGMDEKESIESAIARELSEEVNLSRDFIFKPLAVDNPRLLDRANIWQVRIVFEIVPSDLNVSIGKDADDVQFIDPVIFKDSDLYAEKKIYEYSLALAKLG